MQWRNNWWKWTYLSVLIQYFQYHRLLSFQQALNDKSCYCVQWVTIVEGYCTMQRVVKSKSGTFEQIGLLLRVFPNFFMLVFDTCYVQWTDFPNNNNTPNFSELTVWDACRHTTKSLVVIEVWIKTQLLYINIKCWKITMKIIYQLLAWKVRRYS